MLEPTTLSEADREASPSAPGPDGVRPAIAAGGRSNGHAQTGQGLAGLSASQLRDAYYHLCLTRALDERMRALNRQGKAPFAVSCAGHEAAQIGSALALVPGEDWVLPYYRDLGVMIVLGFTAREA